MKIEISDNTPNTIAKINELNEKLNAWCFGRIELDKEQRDKIEGERNGLLLSLSEQIEYAIFFADKPQVTNKPRRATTTSLKTLLDDF